MPRVRVWFLRTSLVCLGLGFTLGALMLAGKGLGTNLAWLRLRPAHVEFLLFGWTVQLVMGVAVWILPRFGVRRSPVRHAATAWLAFGLLNVGVLLAGVGPLAGGAAGPALALTGRLAEAGAAIAFAGHVWARVTPSGLSEM